ncbi:MarR family winged helix-turn-helix transcriptional regulator [Tranquillimonas alkanivorans]|uniref:MarR family winged helix-turn-helix transcriptional regulator n=1 Tax=Tranquillimonas alkanivorans TaxID=441119 RepID=UPI001C434DC7|nr:MarR family winged helix-turn-helix transcriptional regulator [Tranquillimonas alkanivorans]
MQLSTDIVAGATIAVYIPAMSDPEFDLGTFLPFLLNQAAEATSRAFEEVYESEYGMTRPQWRVLANLGTFGPLTATEICRRGGIEKTAVSRAVQALEGRGLLKRQRVAGDRRAEQLELTNEGRAAFARLGEAARKHDRELRNYIGTARMAEAERVLRALAEFGRS